GASDGGVTTRSRSPGSSATTASRTGTVRTAVVRRRTHASRDGGEGSARDVHQLELDAVGVGEEHGVVSRRVVVLAGRIEDARARRAASSPASASTSPRLSARNAISQRPTRSLLNVPGPAAALIQKLPPSPYQPLPPSQCCTPG